MQVKKLKDFFDENKKWISVNTTIMSVGDWTTLTNGAQLDARLYDFYGDKIIDKSFSEYSTADFNAAVANFVNSHVYELDGLYHTTDVTYNPIENYDMQEAGTDSGNSSGTAGSDTSGTSYDSTTAKLLNTVSSSSSASSSSNHSLRRHGNIGVTTTQQLLQSQRDLVQFDFIGHVAELIVNNFTCSLYDPVSEVLKYDSYII